LYHHETYKSGWTAQDISDFMDLFSADGLVVNHKPLIITYDPKQRYYNARIVM